MHIELDFGRFSLAAELFDTPPALAMGENLPLEIPLTSWGAELYGPMGIDLGENEPQSEIPSGGLAYTNKGNYFCIFFGQRPAWPVEHIGNISGSFEKLETENPRLVTVRKTDT